VPHRFLITLVTSALLAPGAARADVFDQYTNRDLAKAVEADGVRPVEALTVKALAQHAGALPGTQAALVIVTTAEGRHAKLLAQAGWQKVGAARFPILLIERYVTFEEGTERAVRHAGQDVHVFQGLNFSLDLGQVLPAAAGGDLAVAGNATSTATPLEVRPVGKAKLYLVTKAPPATAAPKPTRPVVGETFETRFFNGTYKLHDDGRRSGTLTLTVDDVGEVTGTFYSDKDGRKYDVLGKVGTPRHAIQFTIKFPRVEQTFQGYLFTGDGKALAGTSKLQDREAGFYATRVGE
jgi:hypothetical protein